MEMESQNHKVDDWEDSFDNLCLTFDNVSGQTDQVFATRTSSSVTGGYLNDGLAPVTSINGVEESATADGNGICLTGSDGTRSHLTNDDDVPYQMSSTYSSTLHVNENGADMSSTELTIDFSDDLSKTWQMNYHEAAIYLEEGYNNDKFDYHPRSRDALPAYLVVHNHWFYSLDMAAAILLLFLAMIERPALPEFAVNEGIHASLELLALSVVAIELSMKLRWMGVRYFFRHGRTMIKLTTLIIMIVEALVVLIRRDSHFRVTRALRPVFLIDNHYCGGIRRVIRQILQSLPPIFDMLVLLFFFMMIFALLGFYLFSPNLDDPFFTSLQRSFVSLFVLLTTANYPDIMMPSYSKSRWASVFFIAFLVIHLYFLMNLMLAVVYETFTRIEKDKFRKLMLHRRHACKSAFDLLVSRSSPTRLFIKNFEGLMKYYRPGNDRLDVYLMFKTLDVNKVGYLTIQEFQKVYAASDLNWKKCHSDTPWYVDLGATWLTKVCSVMFDIVTHKWFEVVVYIVIGLSGIYQVVEASTLSGDSTFAQLEHVATSWPTLFFVCFYGIETALKMLGLGLVSYFSSGWNTFDFLVTVTSLVGLIGEKYGVPFAFVYILRCLRLLKLFELKKRYRDIMGTFMFIIMKRFGSVSVVVLIVYYFFAILGMELFSKYNMIDCCKNTSVEQYFAHSNTSSKGYYYLNNFQDLSSSFVTLFELMVVNNWFILMDGYASVTSEWSRVYFMTFYIVTMVVITIVVAFVLEAFLFRIQYKKKMDSDMDKDTLVTVDVPLTREELNFCLSNTTNLANATYLLRLTSSVNSSQGSSSSVCAVYHGSRTRTKFAFCLKMYAEEVKEWIQQEEMKERDRLQNSSTNSFGKSPSTRRTFSCSY